MNFTLESEQEIVGRWLAEDSQLPGIVAHGSSSADAISTDEAVALRVIAIRLEHGEAEPIGTQFLPPLPA